MGQPMKHLMEPMEPMMIGKVKIKKDSLSNKVSQCITPKEDFEVKPRSNNPTLELAIEKAKGLFLD